MKSTRRLIALSALAGLLAGAWLLTGCSGSPDRSQAIERHKKLASELRDNRLYRAAIEEYGKILAYDEIDNGVRANINYLIGRLYFEHLQDYPEAAAYYVRARALDPEAEFNAEASKNLVAALEKSGNFVNAKRQLNKLTDLGGQPASDSDVVVARIDGRPVYLSQVDDALAALPPEAQKQYLDPASKVEFVHQYVGSELLYHAAVRENYDNDPEIARKREQFARQLLIEKYVLDKVIPTIRIDTADVRNFYIANRESRYDGAPYDSVKARVFLDYQSEKAQSAFQDYISMLARKERVEFFDANVQ